MLVQPSSGGNRARNTGIICRAQAMACRRACACAACSEDGRIGITVAMDSSSASDRAASDRKDRARREGFSWAVAKYASMNTRTSTSVGSGGGMSDASEGVMALNLSGNSMHSAMGFFRPLAVMERPTPVIWQRDNIANALVRLTHFGTRLRESVAVRQRVASAIRDMSFDHGDQRLRRRDVSAQSEPNHRHCSQDRLP